MDGSGTGSLASVDEDSRFPPLGAATEQARIDYAAERLRLLYVAITRARREPDHHLEHRPQPERRHPTRRGADRVAHVVGVTWYVVRGAWCVFRCVASGEVAPMQDSRITQHASRRPSIERRSCRYPKTSSSPGQLQDAVECRRRFQLRYILELAWPAPVAEPADAYETHVQDGVAFHRLIHQHQIGLPVERLTAQAEGEDEVEAQAEGPGNLAELVAQLSLLSTGEPAHCAIRKSPFRRRWGAIDCWPSTTWWQWSRARRAVIVDWKTSQHRPASAWLAARLQTRVYRYLLVAAGASLNGGQPIAPEQVEMIYWFAAFPDRPERLRYNRVQYEADGRYLASLVAELAQAGEDDFPLTDDVKRCRFCPYRSLCDRGVEAGEMGEPDGDATAAVDAAPADWAAEVRLRAGGGSRVLKRHTQLPQSMVQFKRIEASDLIM